MAGQLSLGPGLLPGVVVRAVYPPGERSRGVCADRCQPRVELVDVLLIVLCSKLTAQS